MSRRNHQHWIRVFAPAALLCSVVLTQTTSPAAQASDPAPNPTPLPGWEPIDAAHPGDGRVVVDVGAQQAPTRAEASPPSITQMVGGRSLQYVEVTFAHDVDKSAIKKAGLTLVNEVGTLALIAVPAGTDSALQALPGVVSVRSAADLRRGLVASLPEAGVWSFTQQANLNFHNAGFTGSGVKVGIIDFFDASKFPTEQASGDLPAFAASQRACFYFGGSCAFGTSGTTHGNNVAEILYDGAPGVTLYLAEVASITDYIAAVDWFAAKGVTIINHSLLGPFDGPGNGTGPAATVVDYAASKGMIWINAAGNAAADPAYTSYKGGYWRGTWNDPNNNRWLNFSGTDESLGTYCGALLGLRWSDWATGRTDYELYVSDLTISNGKTGTKRLIGANNQTAGAAPLEANDLRWLCNHTSAYGPVYDYDHDGFINLWVQRKSTSSATGAKGDLLELMVNGGWFEYSQSAGSASIPFGDSANPNMLSVGATHSDWPLGSSAQGPTNDGRTKPDVVTNGCIDTTLAGFCEQAGFWGTSAAAPDITSDIAVLSGMFGPVPPAQLIQSLRNSGSTGQNPGYLPNAAALPNNQVGWGYAGIGGEHPVTAPQGTRFVSRVPTRILDTRLSDTMWVGPKVMPPNSAVSVGTWRWLGHHVVAVAINVTIVDATRPGFVQVYPSRFGLAGGSSTVNASFAGQTVANFAIVPVGINDELTLYNTAGGHVIIDLLGTFEPNTGDRLNTVTPYRVYDSECDGCTALQAGVPRDITVLGTGNQIDPLAGVPTKNVSAVVVTVTAKQPSGAPRGFLSAVPVSTAYPPTTSTINLYQGVDLSGLAIVPIASGQDKIRLLSSMATDVQVDIVGYFAPEAPGGVFMSLSPTRFADTRLPIGALTPGAGAVTDINVAGQHGVAPDAGVIVFNLTAAAPTTLGDIIVSPGSTGSASTQYRTMKVGRTGGATASAGIARLSDGHVSITATSTTHRILDVSGWFTRGDDPMPPGLITTVTGMNGDKPNASVGNVLVSPSGRYVGFSTTASNLIADDVDIWNDAYLWDRVTGSVTRVSVTDGEGKGNGDSGLVAISEDGNKLLFVSAATNLVDGDTNGKTDLFERDLAAGTTTLIPIAADTADPFRANSIVRASKDLDTIGVSTAAPLFPGDTDSRTDVYVYTRSTQQLTWAIDLLYAAIGVSTGFVLSGDGNTVMTGNVRWVRGVGAAVFDVGDIWISSLDFDASTGLGEKTTQIPNTNAYETSVYRVDMATKVLTEVCHFSGFSSGSLIDNNDDAFTTSKGCDTPKAGLWLHKGGQDTDILRTWNGVAPSGGVFQQQMSDDGGVVAFTTNATNLLKGSNWPGWWFYVYEPITP